MNKARVDHSVIVDDGCIWAYCARASYLGTLYLPETLLYTGGRHPPISSSYWKVANDKPSTDTHIWKRQDPFNNIASNDGNEQRERLLTLSSSSVRLPFLCVPFIVMSSLTCEVLFRIQYVCHVCDQLIVFAMRISVAHFVSTVLF